MAAVDFRAIRTVACQRMKAKTDNFTCGTFGTVGHGKSSVCNAVLDTVCDGTWAVGEDRFEEGWSVDRVTAESRSESAIDGASGLRVTMTDTCGVLDTQGDTENLRDLTVQNTKNATEYNALLYTVPIDKRYDISDVAVMEMLNGLYGKDVGNHVVIVITRGDIAGMTAEREEKMRRDITAKYEEGLGVPLRSAVVTNNSSARTAGGRSRSECFAMLLGELATLIENNPKAFKPPPVSIEKVYEVMENVKRKQRGADFKKVFAAIVTIIPIIGAGKGMCALL